MMILENDDLKYFNHFFQLTKCISHINMLNSDNEDHYDEDVDEFSFYDFFSKIIRRSVRKKQFKSIQF